MKDYYLFGLYPFCLESDSDALKQLEREFRQYRVDSVDEEPRRLEVQNGGFDAPSDLPDGWTHDAQDGWVTATYAEGGRGRFLLQYSADLDRITVRLPNGSGGWLKMAAQYAMMLALCRSCVGLHGVTVVCGEQTVILSAPSGTGKTTLANLLQKHCGAEIINGDFALLTPGTESGTMFEPTPFCGSSRTSINCRKAVSRIVFLEQSPDIEWRCLNSRMMLIRLMSNAFIPSWDAEIQRCIQNSVLQLTADVDMHVFAFPPTREAAEQFYRLIAV